LVGYLVSGLIQLFIDGKAYRVEPGDSWYVPGKVKHGAKVLEDTVVIEVFSPVNQDFLTRISESVVQVSNIFS
jgi:quercetin dioxygenase-like cupin family protein